MARCLCLLAAVFALLGSVTDAQAQAYQNGPPPKNRLLLRDLTVFRWNPIGLITDARVTWRFRLYEHESMALRDNFVGLGLAPVVSGGFARVGAFVEVAPLSMLQLWANYEVVQYYGSSGFLQSWPDAASANYSDSEQERLADLPKGDAQRNYAASGTQLNLGATLQLKVGPVIARALPRAILPHYKLRTGDRVFYDIFNDVLTGNDSWYFVNDLDLAYMLPLGDKGRQLVAGVRWTMTAPFYAAKDFADGTVQTTGNGPTHRLGPLFAYTFFQNDGAMFNAPTIVLVLNWWLKHEYRTGRDVSQAVPYFVLGFSFSSDFLAPAGR